MKRWLAALMFVAVCTQPAAAQKFKGDVVLTLQGGIGIPVATFSHDYGTAPEFMAQVEYAVSDGTAVGLRGGYRQFNVNDDAVLRESMSITNFLVQAKRLFTPDNRFGLYAVGGWGIYWYKENFQNALSEPAWGGMAGLGLHYEASDKISFIAETTYNGFFANPDGLGYFSVNIGMAIGIREE